MFYECCEMWEQCDVCFIYEIKRGLPATALLFLLKFRGTSLISNN